ncbi:MAG: outer membrane beta-barrel protein [Gammaproteobacteria bacterium]
MSYRSAAAMTLSLAVFAHNAAPMDQVRAGTRDARDLHAWLENQPRGPGIQAGPVLWQPTLPVALRYDDNIFASNARDVDDFVFGITPSLLASAKGDGHEFALSAYTRSDVYFDETRQDNTEYGASAFARVRLLDWLHVSGRYRFDQLTEDWDSPDIPLGAAEPPDVEQIYTKLGMHLRFGRFSQDTDFTHVDVTYDNVPALGGGSIRQDVRNRDYVDVGFTFAWQLTPALQPFVRLRWNDHSYDNAPPLALADRDGDGHALFGGVNFDLAQNIAGSVYGGYVFQDFDDDDRALEEADGIGFGAEIDWRLSSVTTLNLDALREIEEATTGLESGRFTTTVWVGGEHRLTDQLALEALFGYANDDYVGTPRDEDTFRVRLSATQELGHDLYSQLMWSYGDRDSNAPGRSYDRNQIMLSFGWRR